MTLDLSIVIVNYNTKDLLEDCVRSIIVNINKIDFEIIIIDNGSSDGSKKIIKKFTKKYTFVKAVFNKSNLGFGQANNLGMMLSKGEFILLLNSDTKIEQKGMLDEIILWLRDNPNIGVFSCALVNKDGSVQGTGGYFPTLIRVFSWMTIQDLPYIDKFIKPFHPMKENFLIKGDKFYNAERDLDWVTGAFFMMRKNVVHRVGGFDKEYFMYTEDVDYCYRVKQLGWKVYYNPKWKIVHLGGASSNKGFSIINEFKGIEIFYRKHYKAWNYPILRIFLKLGSLWRMIVFGIINGKESFNTYAKAFKVS